jgi:hypothetical protein
MNILNTRDGLLKRIHDKRRNIKSYVKDIEPVGIRLTNLNIICGAIATVFTATPALGGETLLGVPGISRLSRMGGLSREITNPKGI